jgi:hypothetical protein
VAVWVVLGAVAGFTAGTRGPDAFVFFTLGYLVGSFLMDALTRTKEAPS